MFSSRRLLVSLLALLVFPAMSFAIIIMSLSDPFDERKVLEDAKKDAKVIAYSKVVEDFREDLMRFKERDFLAMFGKPPDKWTTDKWAMPVPEHRVIAMSGIYGGAGKKHTDTYLIKDFARIDVFFDNDGVSPQYVNFYLTPDKEFVPLRRIEDLQGRLAWEQPRFDKLVQHFKKQHRLVFPWQVDLDEAKKIYSGLNSGLATEKLEAMKDLGQKAGYRLEHRPATKSDDSSWTWYKGDEVKALATPRGRHGPAGFYVTLSLTMPDGTVRDESGWPNLFWTRWKRDGQNLRYESGLVRNGVWVPSTWCWYDKTGKSLRCEEDDNQDGIPDWYKIGDWHDRKAERHPLALDQSWAIHPELIPEESRLIDQPERRVPLRKVKP